MRKSLIINSLQHKSTRWNARFSGRWKAPYARYVENELELSDNTGLK